MSECRALYTKGKLREALEVLDPPIDRFSEEYGELPTLVKPLSLSAEIMHRLDNIIQAHARLERMLVIAAAVSESSPLSLADALCLAGLVERAAHCAGSIAFYERGIREGEKIGADRGWMIKGIVATVNALLELQPHSGATLSYAIRAADLADASSARSLRFVTRFNLGRAQLDAGHNVEATATFEALIRFREQHRGFTNEVDGRAEELAAWLSKAKGSGP